MTDDELTTNDQSPTSPDRKRLPWISITALCFALLAVITYIAIPKIVHAATPQPAPAAPSPSQTLPAMPAPADMVSEDSSSQEQAPKQQSSPESDPSDNQPNWRELGSDLLKKAAKHLEESSQEEVTEEEAADNTDEAGAPPSGSSGDDVSFSAANGSFQLTIGNAPPATLPITIQPARPQWVDRLELGLLLGCMIASGLAIVIGLTSVFTAEPMWLGLAASALGGTVIIAYVVALIASIMMGLVAIIILGIILSALAGAGA